MNPLNKIFAILISQEVKLHSKIELYERIEIGFLNDIEPFTKLYKIVGQLLSTGENPNAINVSLYAKNNNLFTSKFSVVTISSLISEFNWNDLTAVNSYIVQLQQDYSLREMQLIIRDLNANLTCENPTLEKLRNTLTRGIELTDIQQSKNDSNNEILDRVLIKHEDVRNGKNVGIELGFSKLREKVVLEDVDMMVIGARPSMGKTAFAVSTLVKLVFQENEKVLFFALEMSKEQMMRRIISNITGIAGWKIKYGKLSNDELLRIEGVKQLEQWNNFEIIEGSQNADEIYFATASRKNKELVTVLMVDYLQKIKGNPRQSKYEVVTNASNRMKELSQNLKIPTICLAQLGRGIDARGGSKRPVLSDLRDSGEIEQDASIIAFLHRDEYYGIDQNENGETTINKGEFIVAKNRDGEIGIFDFNICPDTIKWSDNETFTNHSFTSLNEHAGNNFEKTNETPF